MLKSPALRALRLLAAILALCAVGLLANRWHAGRALESARARSEALGLRIDLAAMRREPPPEARAALLAADETCSTIRARGLARYEAEWTPVEFSEERLDALTRAEAHREAAALEAAATRLLAAGVSEQPGIALWRELSAAADEAPGARVSPQLVRNCLVEYLSGAARVAFAEGGHTQGWRWLELAARVCATQRGTDITSAGSIGLMQRTLTAAYREAVLAAPDDPARERVRAALRELDIVHEARAGLRNDASVLLSMVDALAARGDTHGVHSRLVSIDLRDEGV